MSIISRAIRGLADDPRALEAARRAVEDTLIEFRDERISIFGRGNGLVIRERDGRDSAVIRLGTEDALRMGLRAIATWIEAEQGVPE